MDLAPGQHAQPAVSPYDREHINELLRQLAQVDAVVGAPVPKTRMNAGIVGIIVPAERLPDVARVLRDGLGFDMLTCISGVDMVDHQESIYHFRAIARGWLLQVRVQVPNDAPEVPSLMSLYPSANWLEREVYDLSGVTFTGHPDLRRILLDDEFVGHPLLKSFHPTPVTEHDRATTQVDAARALSGEQQHHQERVTLKRLGQGNQERIHPGMMTFGSEAVFLTTGQGIGTDDNAMHGYSVESDTDAPPIMKPQEG